MAKSLFQTKDSPEHVVQEALSKLPITDPNVLIALFKAHENTIINQLRESKKL